MNKLRLLVLFALSAFVFAGLRLTPVYADEGCLAGMTARATFTGGSDPGKYKTCYRTTCSGYSPPWTKLVVHMSTAIPPVLIVDAQYKIQGGGMTGLPACLPEISSNAGWTQ